MHDLTEGEVAQISKKALSQFDSLSKEDKEDCRAEAEFEMIKTINLKNKINNQSGYLATAIHNNAINKINQKKKQPPIVLLHEEYEEYPKKECTACFAPPNSHKKFFGLAVSQINSEQMLVVSLHNEGFKRKDISKLFKKSPNTVKSQYDRTEKKLKSLCGQFQTIYEMFQDKDTPKFYKATASLIVKQPSLFWNLEALFKKIKEDNDFKKLNAQYGVEIDFKMCLGTFFTQVRQKFQENSQRYIEEYADEVFDYSRV